MHDLRSKPMQATQDAQDREIPTAGEKAMELAEAHILALPHPTKPRIVITDLQRWLDMCG
jgi:hypothetical protein